MTADYLIKIGKITGLVSFLLGTFFFGLCFWKPETIMVLFVIGIAIIINMIVLGLILAKEIKEANKKLLKTAGFVSMNIIVLLLYCWIIIILINMIRVTLTNSGTSILTDLNISGCEVENIDKLEVGDSKTVWIDIPHDCSVTITYLCNKNIRTDTIVGYGTNNGGGEILKYKIGCDQ
ncbi:hypothetical protein MTQ00_21865 [Chryseobacterium sp. B21-037]|uniref:hypothetical protein n=1 Tax=Chryseobacterium sp. B21-037 TaxID=2926038 RepID=UPI00235929C1|nr:hypothetical protein [Chryseobacterium sp. B21-037]MDC8107137.1 hypothetical protein [Chryseobacterium sp. B21-037]WBV56332.1 hypothetical protein PFY10_19270 [Chryseobacterium daecheongense]